MELIENLKELEIGDWVKVYPKDTERYPFKIGEITHKWDERGSLCFQLKIFETNLPLTTEKIMERLAKAQKIEKWIKIQERRNKCGKEDRIFRLNEEEKSTLLKRMILENL